MFGKLYSKYIEANDLNIYSETLQILPTPRYFVFYNGCDNAPETEDLCLTNAFAKPDKSSIEVTATVYNVNATVDSCIRDGILADFLRRHKAEVMDVVLTEYDEVKHIKMIEKEAEARGEAIGQIKGAIKLGRKDPTMTDEQLVSKLVNIFELTEDEAWKYVRNCE